MDSFDDGLLNGDTYDYKRYNNVSARPTPSTSYGRFGTKGVRLGDSANDYLQVVPGSSDDTIIVGLAAKVINVGGSTFENLLYLYDTANGYLNGQVYINLNGAIGFRNGNNEDQGSSAVGAVPMGTWCYIEVKVVFHPTAGTVDIRVNGTSVLSLTAKDTVNNIGDNDCGTMNICTATSGSIHDVYIDDLVIMDSTGSTNNAFLGDVKVVALLPNGNGNSSQMTGSDGNSTDNYLLVDDDPVVTTDYVESSTVNDHDSYAMENLGFTPTSVYGVQVSLVAQKDDTGARSMKPMLRTGSTDYYGTQVALSTSWAAIREIWDVNPNTTNAWTGTEIDGIEVGQEVSA